MELVAQSFVDTVRVIGSAKLFGFVSFLDFVCGTLVVRAHRRALLRDLPWLYSIALCIISHFGGTLTASVATGAHVRWLWANGAIAGVLLAWFVINSPLRRFWVAAQDSIIGRVVMTLLLVVNGAHSAGIWSVEVALDAGNSAYLPLYIIGVCGSCAGGAIGEAIGVGTGIYQPKPLRSPATKKESGKTTDNTSDDTSLPALLRSLSTSSLPNIPLLTTTTNTTTADTTAALVEHSPSPALGSPQLRIRSPPSRGVGCDSPLVVPSSPTGSDASVASVESLVSAATARQPVDLQYVVARGALGVWLYILLRDPQNIVWEPMSAFLSIQTGLDLAWHAWTPAAATGAVAVLYLILDVTLETTGVELPVTIVHNFIRITGIPASVPACPHPIYASMSTMGRAAPPSLHAMGTPSDRAATPLPALSPLMIPAANMTEGGAAGSAQQRRRNRKARVEGNGGLDGGKHVVDPVTKGLDSEFGKTLLPVDSTPPRHSQSQAVRRRRKK